MRLPVHLLCAGSLSCLLLAGVSGSASAWAAGSAAVPASVPAPAPTAPSAVAGVARGVPDSFADLAARLLPAVVNVSTTQTVKSGDDDDDEDGDGEDQLPQMPNFPQGSPFEKFFHDFMNRQNSPTRRRAACRRWGPALLLIPPVTL